MSCSSLRHEGRPVGLGQGQVGEVVAGRTALDRFEDLLHVDKVWSGAGGSETCGRARR